MSSRRKCFDWRLSTTGGDEIVFFLLRCLICISVVYALALSDRASSPTMHVSFAGLNGSTPSATPARRPRLTETTKAMFEQGVDALGVVVRDRCLSSPQACVEAARKLNDFGAR
jgi:hypothetical protein